MLVSRGGVGWSVGRAGGPKQAGREPSAMGVSYQLTGGQLPTDGGQFLVKSLNRSLNSKIQQLRISMRKFKETASEDFGVLGLMGFKMMYILFPQKVLA